MTPRNPIPAALPLPSPRELRGFGQLAVDGVTGVTDLVEAIHAAITHLPAVIGRPAPATTTGLTRAIYHGVRGITRGVGKGLDLSLARLDPLLPDGPLSPRREALLAAMNGVLGDHLAASGNPLAIDMQLRRDGRALTLTRKALASAVPEASGKLLVLVHGLCMNDLQWRYAGHDHGAALARDLGHTPVYLHYNSGQHISTNGRAFAALLEQLVEAWPVPVEDVVLLCHSMGGLVARSALDHATTTAMTWSSVPTRLVFLGTPHHGAPLERAGRWADMLVGISPYSAPLVRLGKIRSAGIQDLRHGNVRDSDWHRDHHEDIRTPLPLPRSIPAYAVAASIQAAPTTGEATRLRGDGLVPVASALGQHASPEFDLRIPKSRHWVGHDLNHLGLLGSARVYQRLVRWLRDPATPSSRRAAAAGKAD